MIHLRVWLSRMIGLLTMGRREADLSEEIQAHLDSLTDEYVARGLSPSDAAPRLVERSVEWNS
jgi:hypothetical protein